MNLLIYLLKVSACTGVFYSFYFLILRRLTFFTLNRWYLVAALALSFIIPQLNIPISSVPDAVAPINVSPIIYAQTEAIAAPLKINEASVYSFDWALLLPIAYLLIALFFFTRLAYSLWLFKKRTAGNTLMNIEGVSVFESKGADSNSSFMNAVFVNTDELTQDELAHILTHEMAHITLKHSFDKVLLKTAQVILWFNPFIYAFIRSVEENHEFEVDRKVSSAANKSNYASLLLKLSLASNSALLHSFSKRPLKKRITMLFTKPSSNMKKIMYVLTVPLVLISCFAFSRFTSGNRNLQTRRISAVNGLDKLGPHPLVFINDKQYPDAILYTISGRCITSTTTASNAVAKYGAKAKDGVVKITTRGPIVNITPTEHDNLVKKAAIPAGQFFTRLRLKNEDGAEYDEIIFQLPSGGKMSSEVGVNEKVAFVVGDKIYGEDEMKELEQRVSKEKMSSFGAGSTKSGVNPNVKVDLKGFENYFYFSPHDSLLETYADTVKYRQKLKRTTLQQKEERIASANFQKFKNTAEYKLKMAQLQRVQNKLLTYKVTGINKQPSALGSTGGIIVKHNAKRYELGTLLPEADIKNILHAGDEIKMVVSGGFFAQGKMIGIIPLRIEKDNQIVFRRKQAISNYAFLYETNKVRFADAKVTKINAYANGRWKYAELAVNGYVLKLNVQPNAPEFKNIEVGDNVRFRFVNEKQTGAKEYTISNWVSITKDIKNYGIKNPDYFFRYYEKAV